MNTKVVYPDTVTVESGTYLSPYPNVGTYLAQDVYAQGCAVKPHFDLLDVLRMRLGIPPGEKLPFQYVQVFKATSGKYIVFVVQKDTGTILEDAELFPSDKLITQLRLIAE